MRLKSKCFLIKAKKFFFIIDWLKKQFHWWSVICASLLDWIGEQKEELGLDQQVRILFYKIFCTELVFGVPNKETLRTFRTKPPVWLLQKGVSRNLSYETLFFIVSGNGSVRNLFSTKPIKVLPVYPGEDPF